MRNAQARTTYLKDYQPPAFLIETTDLHFDLHEEFALVTARLLFKRNQQPGAPKADNLILNGRQLHLEKLLLDNTQLLSANYILDEDGLTISGLTALLGRTPDEFTLECHTRLEPQKNTALEGLFKSGAMFCTQCEAEGFRRITYYLDRPDVMAKFTTTIFADRSRYPILLSNGNNVASGIDDRDANRHWVSWEDPFKKPSYLFALVAGDLACIKDEYTTGSGRKISLQIFVEPKDLDKCDHAIRSLKNAMGWDEKVYGREYDLDIFMIVAVDDFNMGAMENKGLNIFNTSCVLANPKTTTDFAFLQVEAVVAHEYFHNWSGNRVTCRDWFQLSLKEGFTVFRDAEFSKDFGSATVKRIEEVGFLRTVQFAEDAGPMAHSVRPDSYMQISNFYTVTIYEKGSEVVRMLSLLLGPEKFRAGSDLYFDRHDGQAVTTEDFMKAMEDASGVDLVQFRNWYSQAGTPALHIKGDYNESARQYTLTVEQSCPDTPGQSAKDKLPFHIPLRVGLLDSKGKEIPLLLHGGNLQHSDNETTDCVLSVTKRSQQFIFDAVPTQPIPSLLRGFSAPVHLHFAYSREHLYFLMVHDTDGFNRWNASQQLGISVIAEVQSQIEHGRQLTLPEILLQAYAGVLDSALADTKLDKAMLAHLLNLPNEGFLIETADVADVDGIHAAREFLINSLAAKFEGKFGRLYMANLSREEFKVDAQAIAQRALKNLALVYLVRTGKEQWIQRCYDQFKAATNMTDQLAALRILVNCDAAAAAVLTASALDSFCQQWQHEPLVMDQWFIVQATCQLPNTLDHVKKLMHHPAFNIKNPNKVRSLIGVFAGQNHIAFHDKSGAGYEFLADQILALDKLNPQIASRLITPLTRWHKFGEVRQQLMKAQLTRIKAEATLSKDAFEVVEKSTA